MKHIFTYLTLIFSFAILSCSTESSPNQAKSDITTLTITTEHTRTHLSGDETHAKWDDADQLIVFESANTTTARTSGKANINASNGKASFSVDFPTVNTTNLRYVAVYPATSVTIGATPNTENVNITIPITQYSTSTSYDGDADILISNVVTRSQQQTSLTMKFKRMVAVAKMTLTQIPFSTIDKVEFSAGNTNIAGSVMANLDRGSITSTIDATNKVTIVYNEPINATSPIYFTLLPTTLISGDVCSITIYSGSDSYTHQFTIPSGRTLSFVDGAISTFSVNMNYKEVVTDTDLSEIEGTWRLSKWCGTTDFGFEVYLDIDKDGAIDLWQRMENRTWDYYRSNATLSNGVLSGVYSDGNLWGSSYRFTLNDSNTMTWVDTQDNDDISVYVRAELPDDINNTRAKETPYDNRFL